LDLNGIAALSNQSVARLSARARDEHRQGNEVLHKMLTKAHADLVKFDPGLRASFGNWLKLRRIFRRHNWAQQL
jgi:hypothetical protein